MTATTAAGGKGSGSEGARVGRAALRWIVAVLVAWAAATIGVLERTRAHTAYALAAHTARTLAAHQARALASRDNAIARPESTAAPQSPASLSTFAVIASAPLADARAALERYLNRRVRALDADDRALVHTGTWRAAVTVPIKDVDAWDIVGVVAVAVSPWDGMLWWALGLAVAALAAGTLTRRAVLRLAEDGTLSPLARIAPALAILAAAALAVAWQLRGRVAAAAASLPAATALARFDALTLPLPSAPMAELAVVLLWGFAAMAIAAAAWIASARRRPVDRRETLAAWAFLAPSALHLLIFTAGPLAFTLWVSLHEWDLLSAVRPWVGLGNYAELLRDPLFWRALLNTALYALYVPVSMALALGAALVLDQPLRGMKVLRAIVFLPTVVSYVAIAVVWQWMFNLDFGLLNFLLRAVHLPAVDWLGNPRTALIAVMIVSAWVQLGYQMVIYLAGLQGIPAHLHEAATLDGAAPWARFRHITIPLLRPVTIYLFVTGIIWSFQVFTLVYVMTEGGPVHATDVLVYRIYQNAWEFRRMGYASAMSWIVFAILLALTLLQWRVLNRRGDDVA
ncbi:MAG: sugar ABC transporter permease [Gemmatimonadaceae bacterium]|nr:sugar ABC transporter permease [Gemmatimonadaceae bacterium]